MIVVLVLVLGILIAALASGRRNATSQSTTVKKKGSEEAAADEGKAVSVSREALGEVAYVDGDYYFWKYSAKSFDKKGTAAVAVPGVKNTLVCLHEGKTTRLFQKAGSGKILVAGNTVYYEAVTDTNGKRQVHSCRLDGTRDVNLGEGELLDVTSDGYLFMTRSSPCEDAFTGFDTLNLQNGTRKNVSEDGAYLTEKNGIVLYQPQKSTMQLCTMETDGSGSRVLCQDSTYYNARIGQVIVRDTDIWFTFGRVNGSTWKGGDILKTNLYGSVRKKVISDGTATQYFTLNDDQGVSCIATGQVSGQLLNHTQTVFTGDDRIVTYTSGAKQKELVSSAELKSFGQSTDRSQLYLYGARQIGNSLFYRVAYAIRKDSKDDALQQVRGGLFRKDLQTGKISKVYRYGSSTAEPRPEAAATTASALPAQTASTAETKPVSTQETAETAATAQTTRIINLMFGTFTAAKEFPSEVDTTAQMPAAAAILEFHADNTFDLDSSFDLNNGNLTTLHGSGTWSASSTQNADGSYTDVLNFRTLDGYSFSLTVKNGGTELVNGAVDFTLN